MSIEPYILHQPLKISLVFLLPPIAKARGAKKVKTEVITYLSPISKRSLTICTIKTTPTIITSSHFAPEPNENILSSGVVTVIASGRSSRLITVPAIEEHISHISLDVNSKKENANVLKNKVFGSSASKPAPDIIIFIDWNTRLPISNAQPSATNTSTISDIIGAVLSKYDKSIDITPSSSPEAYAIISIIIS